MADASHDTDLDDGSDAIADDATSITDIDRSDAPRRSRTRVALGAVIAALTIAGTIMSAGVAAAVFSQSERTVTTTTPDESAAGDTDHTSSELASTASPPTTLTRPNLPALPQPQLQPISAEPTNEPSSADVEDLLERVAPPAPRPVVVPKPSPDELAALPSLSSGSSGDAVRLLQNRLNELGFRAGEADGQFGFQLGSAVLAFTKHEGLRRTRSVGQQVWQQLWNVEGVKPSLVRKMPRVEVDLDRQVAFFVLSPTETWILNISSGGNYYYQGSNGRRTFAATPPGEFVIERRINGIRVSPLGRLYRPLYFNGGIAIHGSNNVPGYADSHGCIRVSNPDLDWLWDKVPNGSPVIVHPSMRPAAQYDMFNNHLPAAPYAAAALGSTGQLTISPPDVADDSGDDPDAENTDESDDSSESAAASN